MHAVTQLLVQPSVAGISPSSFRMISFREGIYKEHEVSRLTNDQIVFFVRKTLAVINQNISRMLQNCKRFDFWPSKDVSLCALSAEE